MPSTALQDIDLRCLACVANGGHIYDDNEHGLCCKEHPKFDESGGKCTDDCLRCGAHRIEHGKAVWRKASDVLNFQH